MKTKRQRLKKEVEYDSQYSEWKSVTLESILLFNGIEGLI